MKTEIESEPGPALYETEDIAIRSATYNCHENDYFIIKCFKSDVSKNYLLYDKGLETGHKISNRLAEFLIKRADELFALKMRANDFINKHQQMSEYLAEIKELL